jgi:hypothetical protein
MTATAYTLGASWLGTDVIGLPLGAWAVAGAALAAHMAASGAAAGLGSSRSLGRSVGRTLRAAGLDDRTIADGPLGTLSSATADAVAGTRRGLERLGRRLTARSGVLRVALDVTEAERTSLTRAAGELTVAGTPVEVAVAPAGLVKDGPVDCRSRDALLRRGPDGRMHLFVPADPERPAAWPDWGVEPPTGYAGLFPVRLDTSRTDLGVCDLDDPAVASLVMRLTVAAAVLGQSPARLAGPGAGLAGALGGRATLANWSACVDAAMEDVAAALLAVDPSPAACESVCGRAAARVVTAWLAGHAGERLSSDRLDMARAAAKFGGGEPETAMRVAALEIGAGHGDQGVATLARAAAQLRALGAECETDPVAFIMSEAELGGDALAVGRIAAGVALAWCTADPDTTAYLREDLTDDLQHAPWLKGRPGDFELIESLLDRLDGRSAPGKPSRRIDDGTRGRRRARKAA